MSSKKKQKSQTQVTIPPPTAEETKSRQLQASLQQLTLSDAGYEQAHDEAGNYWYRKRELTPEEQATASSDAAFEQQVKDYIQKQITNPGPTDEQRALVQNTYDAARQQGTSQIDAFAREQAGSRGLDLTTDSPAMRESLMAKSSLETGLGGAQASSLLDIGSKGQYFAQALNEFRSQLQQQKFINQNAMAGQYGNTGMQLASIRGMEPNTRTIQSQSGGPGVGMGILNGLMSGFSSGGGLMGGLGGMLGGGTNAKA